MNHFYIFCKMIDWNSSIKELSKQYYLDLVARLSRTHVSLVEWTGKQNPKKNPERIQASNEKEQWISLWGGEKYLLKKLVSSTLRSW